MTARNGTGQHRPAAPDTIDEAIAAVRERLVDEPEPAPAAVGEGPVLTIRFAGPGAADLTVDPGHTSPAQLYAAAFYLDTLAREVLHGAIVQAASRQIVSASPTILSELRRSGRV